MSASVAEAREILNVSRGVDGEALKKAYRRAALKSHPDKGGDALAFQRVAEAYQLLEAARLGRLPPPAAPPSAASARGGGDAGGAPSSRQRPQQPPPAAARDDSDDDDDARQYHAFNRSQKARERRQRRAAKFVGFQKGALRCCCWEQLTNLFLVNPCAPHAPAQCRKQNKI